MVARGERSRQVPSPLCPGTAPPSRSGVTWRHHVIIGHYHSAMRGGGGGGGGPRCGTWTRRPMIVVVVVVDHSMPMIVRPPSVATLDEIHFLRLSLSLKSVVWLPNGRILMRLWSELFCYIS